jgi:hypothetical protein
MDGTLAETPWTAAGRSARSLVSLRRRWSAGRLRADFALAHGGVRSDRRLAAFAARLARLANAWTSR